MGESFDGRPECELLVADEYPGAMIPNADGWRESEASAGSRCAGLRGATFQAVRARAERKKAAPYSHGRGEHCDWPSVFGIGIVVPISRPVCCCLSCAKTEAQRASCIPFQFGMMDSGKIEQRVGMGQRNLLDRPLLQFQTGVNIVVRRLAAKVEC